MQQQDFARLAWRPIQVAPALTDTVPSGAPRSAAVQPVMTGLAAVGALASVSSGVAVATTPAAEVVTTPVETVMTTVSDQPLWNTGCGKEKPCGSCPICTR